VFARNGFEHLARFRDYFRPDTVTGQNDNLGFHRARLQRARFFTRIFTGRLEDRNR
jgi:hypothetical protein